MMKGAVVWHAFFSVMLSFINPVRAQKGQDKHDYQLWEWIGFGVQQMTMGEDGVVCLVFAAGVGGTECFAFSLLNTRNIKAWVGCRIESKWMYHSGYILVSDIVFSSAILDGVKLANRVCWTFEHVGSR